MEQHPIPQQISSYQFKLVGDMTLKQFFQVAGGVVISLIFYSLPLHPLIKWPFILFSAGLGAAMAFLPFEERPLERWIIAFFRSIYSPTLYSWKKLDKPPVFYTESAAAPAVASVENTSPVMPAGTAKLEAMEKSFLQKIGSLWSVAGSIAQPSTNTSPAPVAVQQSPSQPLVSHDIPTVFPVVVPKSTPKFVVEEAVSTTSPQQVVVGQIATPQITNAPITSNEVEFSVDAAPPSPPIAPNTIVGQVMDQDRKIIEGAILEIKNSEGRPVRALKSNKAGHFIIVTPLANGKYEVTIEKDGFKFEPVSFDAKGEMIPAIAIRGIKI